MRYHERVSTADGFAAERSASLARLIAQDAAGQLLRHDGAMATLGREAGVAKLDWVNGVPRLLADPVALETVEAEARALWDRGIRRVIWAGMGGSVIAVRVLRELGLCGAASGMVAVEPLDSTDPTALNRIVERLAVGKGIALPQGSEAGGRVDTPRFEAGEGLIRALHPGDGEVLRALLSDVLLLAVSMGMTSEEPITHLRWFAALIQRAGLPAANHLLVMTLPGSHLDRFAIAHGVPSRPLQLDGRSGTGGRMSAPSTQVFLLPAALAVGGQQGALRRILAAAWAHHSLDTERPTAQPFARLAAALSDAAHEGGCRLQLQLPIGWEPLFAWIEQLLEESLGKGGKGVVVFEERAASGSAATDTMPGMGKASGTLSVQVRRDGLGEGREGSFALRQPYLKEGTAIERLAALAASFLGWQLTMALYGYLHGITFAGQPAVEQYKSRAAALRDGVDEPLLVATRGAARLSEGAVTLYPPAGWAEVEGPAATLARAILELRDVASPLAYLDLTINGDWPPELTRICERFAAIGAGSGLPVKLRRAPAAYHATEQSEMDGPPALVSLRLLRTQVERCLLGDYDDRFLRAQAAGTWQAMGEAGRSCFLLVLDGDVQEAAVGLGRFLKELAARTSS